MTMADSALGEWEVLFTPERIAAYARASGDNNPIHVDPQAARRAGFPEVLAPGMLLMAHVEQAGAAWRRDRPILDFAARFVRPLLANQKGLLVARSMGPTGPGGGKAARFVLRTSPREIICIADMTVGPERR
jgi:hypothetical protein